MGTNYYAHKNECKCCGRAESIMHIGKRSAGWRFALHVERIGNLDNEPTSLEEWKAIFANREYTLRDEYRHVVSADDMLSIIIDRKGTGKPGDRPSHCDGAVVDEDGLLKRKIDWHHCVGNGDHCYDLCRGEFS